MSSNLIRNYEERDLERLRDIHALTNPGYALPKLDSLDMIARAVYDEGPSGPTGAVFLRRTTEAYLLIDPRFGSRKERIGKLVALHREVVKLCEQMDIKDTHAWVSPRFNGFGDLLLHLGWAQHEWDSYSYTR